MRVTLYDTVNLISPKKSLLSGKKKLRIKLREKKIKLT